MAQVSACQRGSFCLTEAMLLPINTTNGGRNLNGCKKLALWRSGDAADCKSVYAGSIPAGASNPY